MNNRSEDSGNYGRQQGNETHYRPGARHRFEAGEQGPAIDYKQERDREEARRQVFERFTQRQRESQEETERAEEMRRQEAARELGDANVETMVWVAIVLVFLPATYILSEGAGVISVLLLVLGSILLAVSVFRVISDYVSRTE